MGKLAEGEATTSRGVVTDVEVIGKKEDGGDDAGEKGGVTKEATTATKAPAQDPGAPTSLATAASNSATEAVAATATAAKTAATEKKNALARQVTSARSTTLNPPVFKEESEKESAKGEDDEAEETFKSTVMEAVEAAAKTKRAYVSDDKVAQKFDEFMAHFSESLTLGGVVSDAKDGIPGGFGEAVQAMVVAMRNNIMADNVDGVKAVAAEFGELVAALANAFAGAGEDTERTQKTFLDLFDTNLTELTGPAAGPAEDDPASEEEDEDENAEKEGGDGKDAETSEKEGSDAAPEGVATVVAAISDLATKVDANQKSTEEAISEVNTKVAAVEESTKAMEEGLSTRVKELESERQTRKSADDETEGSPAKRRESSLDGIALRGALGISNVSKSGGY